MATVTVLDHPLIQHKLAIMRNKTTGTKEFRALVNEIAGLMCYEATRNLPTEEVLVETPITTAKCRMLAGKKLAIVPILRAGLGITQFIFDGCLCNLCSFQCVHSYCSSLQIKDFYNSPKLPETEDAAVCLLLLHTQWCFPEYRP